MTGAHLEEAVEGGEERGEAADQRLPADRVVDELEGSQRHRWRLRQWRRRLLQVCGAVAGGCDDQGGGVCHPLLPCGAVCRGDNRVVVRPLQHAASQVRDLYRERA